MQTFFKKFSKFYKENEKTLFAAISIVGAGVIMYNRYKILHGSASRKLAIGENAFPTPPFTKQEQIYALQALNGIRNRMYRPRHLPDIKSENKNTICTEIANSFGHGHDFISFCEVYYDRMLYVIHEVPAPISVEEIEENRKLIREKVLKARAARTAK